MQQIFTGEDYKSDSGMMTSIWGPPAWHFLHCISFNYPVKPDKQQKEDYYKLCLNDPMIAYGNAYGFGCPNPKFEEGNLPPLDSSLQKKDCEYSP